MVLQAEYFSFLGFI